MRVMLKSWSRVKRVESGNEINTLNVQEMSYRAFPLNVQQIQL